MANPFLQRATEYIRDDAAFLAVVSPQPLTTFLTKHPRKEDLFRLPVRILGSPGSGKTMLATLAEFRLIEAILRDQSNDANRELAAALADAGFLRNGKPCIAAVRVPMESEYRDFWELPYEDSVKTKLALWLVQARTMLALLRGLTANGTRDLGDIRFVARDASEAQLAQIGGLGAVGIRDRALQVQRAIYSIGASLLPPKIEDLPPEATEPYEPFDSIREIQIDWNGETLSVSPLVMLDDVHDLHPDQFEQMFGAMARREIRFGRWMMMRLDALSPKAVFRSAEALETHNLKPDRDFINVFMQRQADRASERRQFRTIASDMANRYLPLVRALRDRNQTRFGRLVPDEPPRLTDARRKQLRTTLERDQRRLEIGRGRRGAIDQLVSAYLAGKEGGDTEPEVGLAMTRILMHRYAKRVAHLEPTLFEDMDPDPKVPLKADSDVADAARLHLNEEFGRPFHYGMNDLCDASNENAELFLQLSGALVARMEARVVQGKSPVLPAAVQQAVLKDMASTIMNGWSFAFARRVRALIEGIGRDCREASLVPNARLGAGANAIGVPQTEIRDLLASDDELALVLKYAVAYGALDIQMNYGQGNKNWCLIELSGIVCLAHGLTFKRGGFLERDLSYVRELAGRP